MNSPHLLRLALLCVLFFFTACQTITISPKDSPYKLSSIPNYSQRQHFFLWGFIGETTINVKEICPSNKVIQMQTQDTFGDTLFRVVTLGIYSPKTAKVWCEK